LSVLYRNVVKFFIEDKESGIAVFIRRAIPPVHVGDVVRVDGRITLYNGSAEIMASEIDLLFRTQPPTPRIVRAADVVGGRYYGRLVRTQGVVIEANSRWRAFEARIHAGRDLLTVRLTEAQRKVFPKIEVGETISVIGIASVYSGGNPQRTSWEILPRYPSDVQVIESPPWITRDVALKASAAAGAFVIVFLLWNLSLRLRMRHEMREHLESEGRFSAVAETAPVAIFIYQDSVFRYVNRSAEELTGFPAGELVGRPFWDIVAPEFRDLIRERGEARLRGESVHSRYEFQIVRKDGRRLWLDFSATQIRYAGSSAALGTAFDITERKQAEETLQASERRFRSLVENSSDGIALFDRTGKILWAGPSTRRMLGFAEAEVVGENVASLIHEDDRPAAQHAYSSLLKAPAGESAVVTFRMRQKEGDWRYFESTLTNLLGEKAVRAVVANYRDITERRKSEEEMRHQALHDTLTGLPNRNLYHDRLGLALAHSRRTGKALAVMFVDLDLFKLINDSAGHTIGDALLHEVGARLRECVRARDTVARVGGDEFTIIVEDLESVESVTRIADAVLESVARPYAIEHHDLLVTASIGISLFRVTATTLTR
jgi:diguanylate cyclase (GGDEF)-like protein/PAS domain S-box-containing protein